MRFAKTWVVLALALTLSLAGCASTSSREAEKVRATVLRYNELLTQGYRSLDMNPLQEAATNLQSEDEYIFMSSLAEGGIRLDATLKDIQFVKVSVEGTAASAETSETWDYRQYGRADGKLILDQKGLVYHLAWDLERQPNGRWLVSDVRAISATTTTDPSVFGTITPTPPHDRLTRPTGKP